MTLPRVVSVETLDLLGADDPAAQRSRRDLQRVHRAMGTRRTLLRALRELPGLQQRRTPLRVLELGAGDASLMLGVARSLGGLWPAVEFTVLDRQPLVTRATVAAYARLGWRVATDVRDVFEWAGHAAPQVAPDAAAHATPQVVPHAARIAAPHIALPTAQPTAPHAAPRWDLIVANLFLHHFEGAGLGTLLGAISTGSERCVACEPRRSRTALVGSHLVGALGANAVTREDAVLSVHAGFSGTELSAAWPPAGAAWRFSEYPAGLFGHCFVAERSEPR